MNAGDPLDWNTWKGVHWAAMEGRLPDPPTITWREIMIERNAALGGLSAADQPITVDVYDDLPLGGGDRSLEVHFGLSASWVLARHALEVTPSSRLRAPNRTC